jgi:hypothetical protein
MKVPSPAPRYSPQISDGPGAIARNFQGAVEGSACAGVCPTSGPKHGACTAHGAPGEGSPGPKLAIFEVGHVLMFVLFAEFNK